MLLSYFSKYVIFSLPSKLGLFLDTSKKSHILSQVSWDAEIGRTSVQVQPMQKVCKMPLPPLTESWAWWWMHVCHSNYTGSINKKISVQDGLSKKRAGGVAQEVRNQPSKHKILNSNSSTANELCFVCWSYILKFWSTHLLIQGVVFFCLLFLHMFWNYLCSQ